MLMLSVKYVALADLPSHVGATDKEGSTDSGVQGNAHTAGVDVPGGCGGDDSGGGAGGMAVPHLQCVADAYGRHRASAAAQFMMHALGCMSDSKGTWGWLCVCMQHADACVCVQGM